MSIRKCIHSLDSPSSFSPRLPLKSPRSSGFHPLCRHHLPASSPSSRQVPKVIPPVQPTIPESPTWPRSHPALTYSDDLTREDSSRLPLSPPQATSVRARSRLHQPAPPQGPTRITHPIPVRPKPLLSPSAGACFTFQRTCEAACPAGKIAQRRKGHFPIAKSRSGWENHT